jgi:hypothetical protein
MRRVWRGNIDNVHIWIVHKLFVGGIAPRDIELIAKSVGTPLGARPNREQFRVSDDRQPTSEAVGNIARAKDTPSDFVCHE